MLGGQSSLSVDGTVSESEQLVELNYDTSDLTAGNYIFQVWGTTPQGRKIIIEQGSLEITPSAVDLVAGEETALTSAQIIVKRIDEFIASKGITHKRYQLNGREMERHSLEELQSLRKYYSNIAKQELRKANGGKNSRGSIRWRL